MKSSNRKEKQLIVTKDSDQEARARFLNVEDAQDIAVLGATALIAVVQMLDTSLEEFTDWVKSAAPGARVFQYPDEATQESLFN